MSLFASCTKVPSSIPLGKRNYILLVNGVKLGTATLDFIKEEKRYITSLEMQMDAKYVKNYSKQIITESLDFKPIKYEQYNKTQDGKNIEETKIIADFNGTAVTLIALDKKTTFTMEKPFIIDGNFFLGELIKNKFKNGTSIHAQLYDPSIEAEEPIPVVVKVLERKKIFVNEKEKELIHVVQAIKSHKIVDYYFDENGIAQKATISMLNNVFELVLE